MEYEELTEKIIGCFDCANRLGMRWLDSAPARCGFAGVLQEARPDEPIISGVWQAALSSKIVLKSC